VTANVEHAGQLDLDVDDIEVVPLGEPVFQLPIDIADRTQVAYADRRSEKPV
jgi:hypothetical protein